MPIRLLDEATIGKIAAGEVVERPASVVKELIENSLDAGATMIRVEISRGGKELIRVTDNGRGIAPDDLPHAIERHATSKIVQFTDLDNLDSFGFRGEALASIAAVSDLTIVSREPHASHAMRLRSSFGERRAVDPTPAAPGTTISVRDLFANVPARLKFLRQDGTESGYVQRVVMACALSYPEVRFEFIIDGKPFLSTDGSGDIQNTIVGVLGAETAAQMIPIQPVERDPDPERPNITVSGVVGLPAISRGNRQHLFLLVNRRWIESKTLTFALEQAYHTLLMVGRYPIAVVNIQVPPDRVDVNVHPTKREVRFSDERLVFAELQRAVRGTLIENTPLQTIPNITDSPLSPSTIQRRLTLANPERAAPRPSIPVPDPPRPSMLNSDPDAAETEEIPGVLRVLGQLAGMYIIAEGADGMFLIDQHAAHERILLEKLMLQYQSAAPDSQRLLEPLVVETTPAQYGLVEESDEELRQIGFELEPFGHQAVAIRAIPAIMRRRDPKATLLAILDEMLQGGRGTSKLEALAMTTACHSAIRAGQSLSLAEMREMIQQLEGCTAPRACAHGRPTMLHLSQDELERQFARR